MQRFIGWALVAVGLLLLAPVAIACVDGWAWSIVGHQLTSINWRGPRGLAAFYMTSASVVPFSFGVLVLVDV